MDMKCPSLGLVQMQAMLSGLWGRLPLAERAGEDSAEGELQTKQQEQPAAAHEGSGMAQMRPQSKQGGEGNTADDLCSESGKRSSGGDSTVGGVSLAADDWWESSFHISGEPFHTRCLWLFDRNMAGRGHNL